VSVQNDLFSGTRVVERVVAGSGSTVRMRLEPAGEGRVRIVEYFRRRRGEARFRRAPGEENREVPYARLGLEPAFEELFDRPGGPAPVR
jgi:hypothetical protein